MEVLVAYDVSTERSRGAAADCGGLRTCASGSGNGYNTRYSSALTPMQFEADVHRLLAIIDDDEDSLRVYRLREPRKESPDSYGERPLRDLREPLVL